MQGRSLPSGGTFPNWPPCGVPDPLLQATRPVPALHPRRPIVRVLPCRGRRLSGGRRAGPVVPFLLWGSKSAAGTDAAAAASKGSRLPSGSGSGRAHRAGVGRGAMDSLNCRRAGPGLLGKDVLQALRSPFHLSAGGPPLAVLACRKRPLGCPGPGMFCDCHVFLLSGTGPWSLSCGLEGQTRTRIFHHGCDFGL